MSANEVVLKIEVPSAVSIFSVGVVRPGDVLLLVSDHSWSEREFRDLQEYARYHLPGVRVLILPRVRQALVQRGSAVEVFDQAWVRCAEEHPDGDWETHKTCCIEAGLFAVKALEERNG